MATAADYRCADHSTLLEDRVFDHTPPPFLLIDALCTDDPEPCRFDRVWSPVAIGAVQGAGGSPARS